MAGTTFPQVRGGDNALINLLFSASLEIHGAASLTSDRHTADLLRAAIDDLDQSVRRVRNLAFDQVSPPVVDGIGRLVPVRL